VNRLLNLPRWVSFPVALATAVGLVATCYPGGLAAAYEDVRDASELTEVVNKCRQTDRHLCGNQARLRDRVEYKEELIASLVRGETTLAAVTDQFVEMNHTSETVMAAQHMRYGDLELTEMTARNVLDFVDQRVPADAGSSALRSRLAAEFHERFDHRAPGW
jgi:hypothetical protein